MQTISEQPDALPDADRADVAVEQIVPPEQPPMDDAAGGPSVETTEKGPDDDADALQVQGGE